MPTRVYSHPMSPLYSTMVSVMFPLSDCHRYLLQSGLFCGVDISRYKTSVPTSYMAEKSDYDLSALIIMTSEAGYCMLPITMSLGKKQWSWGRGFWPARDRNLTDENGPILS